MKTRNKPQALTPKEQFLAANQREGEVYAGILLRQNGQPDVHVFLLPGDADSLNWEAAKKWAEQQGGELPTRSEQTLLFANRKAEFKPAYYWSGEPHATESRWAWYQSFSDGYQGNGLHDLELRARAVRRLPI